MNLFNMEMDEVLLRMGSTVVNNDIKPPSEFESLFKNWGKPRNQEERRQEILDNQKYNRNTKVDTLRGIIDMVNNVEEDEDCDDEDSDSNEKPYYRPSIYVAGFTRAPSNYQNILMLSEWLVEKPVDFHENWLVTPCPKGVRMLIVAYRGTTKCFSKVGQFQFAAHTALPGGSRHDRMKSCTVLDVVYHDKCKTMYVLDFLAWNNQSMTNCETEFRHYWLRSQFTDMPELGTVSEKNEIKLVLLPKVSCAKEQFNNFMMKWPAFGTIYPLVDGLLFYHRLVHYSSGSTPLVGWLFPYMVPEVLGSDITVHKAYLFEKPVDYIDQTTFIRTFEEKLYKKYRRRTRYSSLTIDTFDINKLMPEYAKELADKMDAEETSQEPTPKEESTDIMDAQEIPKEPNVSYYKMDAQEIPKEPNVSYYKMDAQEIPKEPNVSYYKMDAQEIPKEPNVYSYKMNAQKNPKEPNVSYYKMDAQEIPKERNVSSYKMNAQKIPTNPNVSYYKMDAQEIPKERNVSYYKMDAQETPKQPTLKVKSAGIMDAKKTSKEPTPQAESPAEPAVSPKKIQTPYVPKTTWWKLPGQKKDEQ